MNDDDEFPPLKVTDAPETIWLVYGDIERDCTHAECARGGDVSWCEDSQFASDVRYVRADVSDERVRVLREALQDIIDPIAAWKRDLKDGYTLNGAMCVQMANDPETYRNIARKALEATQ